MLIFMYFLRTYRRSKDIALQQLRAAQISVVSDFEADVM